MIDARFVKRNSVKLKFTADQRHPVPYEWTCTDRVCTFIMGIHHNIAMSQASKCQQLARINITAMLIPRLGHKLTLAKPRQQPAKQAAPYCSKHIIDGGAQSFSSPASPSDLIHQIHSCAHIYTCSTVSDTSVVPVVIPGQAIGMHKSNSTGRSIYQ